MDYKYTSTPVREVALATVVAQANAAIDSSNEQLAKQDPPGKPASHLTNEDYLTARINDVLDSYARQHAADMAQQAIAAFAGADQATQGQSLKILDMADYASLPPAAMAKALSTIGLSTFLTLTTDQQNALFSAVKLGV